MDSIRFDSAPLGDCPDYLRDESRRSGTAEGIAWPSTVDEVAAALRSAAAARQRVTVQGGRTGITAGAVPEGGVIVSLSRMERVLGVRIDDAGRALVRVQPGLTLTGLRAFLDGGSVNTTDWTPAALDALARLRRGHWLFTPDPTETSASLGGMAACNASGACSLAYGPTRDHVEALTVVLADGGILDLQRGGARAHGRAFQVTTREGCTVAGELPGYALPSVKNAAGYFVRPDMDLIDLFIGSEGTLGVIAELELRLTPRPAVTWGIMCFLEQEAQVVDLVERLRQPSADLLRPVALEYFDTGVLSMLRADLDAGSVHVPRPHPTWRHALYVEYSGPLEEAVAAAGASLVAALTVCGGRAEETWTATGGGALRQLKEFRHAAPERVNARIAQRKRQHPKLTKLGTDLSVPDARLRDALAMYRRDLDAAGLEYVVFGHIGNNHVHVNILPRDMDEYAQGQAFYRGWARQVVAWGGSVSAEHGIGKLKVALLEAMYGSDGIAAMRAVRCAFDPAGQLSPGNLFA
jgi:D-lactate dehydrogenase (cytochrome)